MTNFTSGIRSNAKLILISIGSSVLTTAILLLGFFGFVNGGVISIGSMGVSGSRPTQAVATGTAVEDSQVIKTVEKVSPAVVSIVITQNASASQQGGQNLSPFGNLFQLPQQNQNNTTPQEVGQGSGFFVSSDGYIVTNKHVVSQQDASYTVVTNDGNKYNAKVLAKDPLFDVAILKIDGNNFPYASFADSDTIKVGQTAIAIGNALGEFKNSVSTGIVSGLLRSITASTGTGGNQEQLDGVIQTDAAINPGNSGGPLLDIKGNVIGVNVAVEDGAQNIGFALPSNMVKEIVDSVKANGEIVRPYLGVRYATVTEAIAKSNNLPVQYGALVIRGASASDVAVISGSPADKAGIVENDIILEIDGVKLENSTSLSSIIREKKVGQTITVKVSRGSETKDVQVTLERAPTTQ